MSEQLKDTNFKPEERTAIEAQRTLDSAKKLGEGAVYVESGVPQGTRLEVTGAQIEEASKEMERDIKGQRPYDEAIKERDYEKPIEGPGYVEDDQEAHAMAIAEKGFTERGYRIIDLAEALNNLTKVLGEYVYTSESFRDLLDEVTDIDLDEKAKTEIAANFQEFLTDNNIENAHIGEYIKSLEEKATFQYQRGKSKATSASRNYRKASETAQRLQALRPNVNRTNN